MTMCRKFYESARSHSHQEIMRKEVNLANDQAPQPRPQQHQLPSIWMRICLVCATAFALATVIAAVSTDSPYEDRLIDVALLQSDAPRWNSVALNSSAVKALLMDYDNELAFKAQLAIEKYGDDAQDVLERFGDDATFQQVIKQYGENTVPVIAYFVKNDIASIRLLYVARQKGDAAVAAAKESWANLWPQKLKDIESAANEAPQAYGPDLRGQQAIAMISREGHQFLSQFVTNSHGQATWIQTERTLNAMKSLFFSGVIDLEKKYKSGASLQAVDIFDAGADVFFLAGSFKAIKFLRSAKEARSLGVVKRTQLLGAPLLRKSALGRQIFKYGAIAGTAYLMVRHPSLLNGAFVTLGKLLGIPPFLAKLAGWGLLLTPLLAPLVSILIAALAIAGTTFSAASRGMRWTKKYLCWRAAPAV